jgi:hypothetical protein
MMDIWDKRAAGRQENIKIITSFGQYWLSVMFSWHIEENFVSREDSNLYLYHMKYNTI